nr:adrenodoxin, mitochondrial isoform X2 [Globicephala melas]
MAARLLRVASAALGDTAGRWLLLAGPRAGAGGLRGSRGQGGSARPGLGGGAAAATRTLSVSARARRSSEDKITVHFINRDGETLTSKGKVGDTLLDIVVENNLDIDGFGSGCTGSAVMTHGPSRSAACGIFLDHRQADSQPLRHQGSPMPYLFLMCM